MLDIEKTQHILLSLFHVGMIFELFRLHAFLRSMIRLRFAGVFFIVP